MISERKRIAFLRDSKCYGFSRNIYQTVDDMISTDKKLDEVFGFLVDRVEELYTGKIPYQDLVITSKVMSLNYNNEFYYMKIFVDKLQATGKIINVGDKLQYVIVQDSTAKFLGEKMRLLEDFVNGSELLYYDRYVEQLRRFVDPIFAEKYRDIIDKLSHIGYKCGPTPRHKTVHLDNPIWLILLMKRQGHNLNELKEMVCNEYRKL